MKARSLSAADVSGAVTLAVLRICSWLGPDATAEDAVELEALIWNAFRAYAHAGPEERLRLTESVDADVARVLRTVRGTPPDRTVH